jgi:hypothetical protein
MTSAIPITLAVALIVAAVHLWLERGRPAPPEFDDVASLNRNLAARAAMRRATAPRTKDIAP